MFDEHHRLALVGELAEDSEQATGRRRVEVGQRLIDHEQARPHHQRASHREQLPLPARKPRRLAAAQRTDTGALHHLADATTDLRAFDPQVLGAEGELAFDTRANDLLGGVLQHRPHAQRDVPQPQVGRQASFETHASGHLTAIGVRDQSVDRSDQRALATSRGPCNEQDLTGLEP